MCIYIIFIIQKSSFVSPQMEITKCVVRKDLIPEYHWLTFVIDSMKYFLTAMYVYVMKEQ